MTNFSPYAFDPGLVPTFTGGLATSSIDPASPGLCSGPQLNVIGTPVLTVECNGLVRPGGVPSDQVGRVPVTFENPQLLAAIPPTAARGFYNTENVWAPRFGFSYAPLDEKTGDSRWLWHFLRPSGGQRLGQWHQLPRLYTVGAVGLDLGDKRLVIAVRFRSGCGYCSWLPSTISSISGVDPKLVVARSYQYSLGVQRELPQGMLLQASYVGNLGRHILRRSARQ